MMIAIRKSLEKTLGPKLLGKLKPKVADKTHTHPRSSVYRIVPAAGSRPLPDDLARALKNGAGSNKSGPLRPEPALVLSGAVNSSGPSHSGLRRGTPSASENRAFVPPNHPLGSYRFCDSSNT